MSGLLDRMARRALEKSNVHPPIAPRYARMREALRETAAEREAAAHIRAAETETSAQFKSGRSGEAWPDEIIPLGRAQMEQRSEAPAIAEEHEPLSMANLTERRLSFTQQYSPLSETGRKRNSEAEIRLPQTDNRNQRDRSVERPERIEPQLENSNIEPAIEKHKTDAQKDALSEKQVGLRQAAGKTSSNSSSAEPLPRSGPQAAPQREQQPVRPAEERTEVHISIAGLELRAPRAEDLPARKPFQPRVTLDGFLGRGKENRQ